jgi:HAD superfamily hydrolase (TIGR01509 family)
MNLNPVRAVIFDFDGTLVDSEPNYYESDRQMMAGFGIDLTEELKRQFIGVGAMQMMQIFKARYNLSESIEELLVIKDRFYLQQAVGHTVAYPEMERLVRALHAAGMRMAVASGSTSEVLELLLKETGLRPFFEHVVSASEVPRSKPHPDIFLEAARRLGVAPSETAVFEDAPFGVQAAVAAGMRCFAIPGFPEDDLAPAFLTADRLARHGMREFMAEDALAWLDLIDG